MEEEMAREREEGGGCGRDGVIQKGSVQPVFKFKFI